VLGPATIAAAKSGDALRVAREALVRRIDFYARLPGWANFGLGWSRRVIALAGELAT
jgi:lysozyme family protein